MIEGVAKTTWGTLSLRSTSVLETPKPSSPDIWNVEEDEVGVVFFDEVDGFEAFFFSHGRGWRFREALRGRASSSRRGLFRRIQTRIDGHAILSLQRPPMTDQTTPRTCAPWADPQVPDAIPIRADLRYCSNLHLGTPVRAKAAAIVRTASP